jgi:ketosteroid isomerase-like protein
MVLSHGHLWRLRGDVVLSLESYPEQQAALEAAELSGQRAPEANAEVVRRVYKLAETNGVEGLLELATDDVVWISDPHFPGGGTHEGKLNVQRWLRQLWIYDEISIDVEEIVHIEGRVLAITRFHAITASGPPVDWAWHHIFSFRDGRVSQVESLLDRTEALEAAGIPDGP